MTRSDFYRRQSDLESRILNTAYHAGRRGRFERAWNELYDRAVDQLQALIDERDEVLRDARDAAREDEMRHVRQTAEYQRYGAWGVFGRSK